MNLVQVRHPGSIKAYVREFHTQMNGKSKIDKLSKKYIVLYGVPKTDDEYHVQIYKAY